MAFKEIIAKVNYVKYTETKVGTSWEGYYSSIVTSQEYDSKTLILEGVNERIGLPLSGQLKYLISSIPVGAYIKVEYQGKSEKKFKGKHANQFQVWVDDEKSRKNIPNQVHEVHADDIEDEEDLLPF